jgi:hypothetical protein
LRRRACRSPLGPVKWTRVYHVRKAAKEALELMGEKVEGVVAEEPDS